MRVMNTLFLIFAVLSTALVSATVHAAKVEVKWDDVKSFTDIEAVNSRQDRFEQSVVEGLTEHLMKLGEQLPSDHQLNLTIHDVDLTGRVEPTFGDYVRTHQRVLDDLSYPKLVMTYEYVDGQGTVMSSAKMVELKNLAPTSTRRSAMASGRDSLYYEKELLNRWFKDTFKN